MVRAVELRSYETSGRFVFVGGETEADPTDTLKVIGSQMHACLKAELSLLAMHNDKDLSALADGAFVVGALIDGASISLFCHMGL